MYLKPRPSGVNLKKVKRFILLYYIIGGVIFILTVVLFYHIYGIMPYFVEKYEVPYLLKRVVLSASIGASLFQAYLILLGVLFEKEQFFYFYVSRKWLTIDETKKLRRALTFIPWWMSIILLYIIAIATTIL